MILIKERIGKMLEYLQEQVYPKQVAIPSYKMIRTDERCLDVNNLDTSSWTEITNQELWGGHREYYWFETVVTIPEEFDGECVVYELKTGKEVASAQVFGKSTNQFMINLCYGDGKIFVSDISEAYTISEETREDDDE